MVQLYTNNASTAINGGISDVTTAIAVFPGDGAKFPSPTGGDFFLLTLIGLTGVNETSWEIVKVTARATDTFTVVRAQEGTTAVSWADETGAELRMTSGTFVDIDTAMTTKSDLDAVQVLSDGATISWDISTGNVATVTLGGNRTIAAPTNLVVGSMVLVVNQDATGIRTLAWDSLFEWTGGLVPSLSTASNAKDVISFVCDGTTVYGSLALRGAS